MSLLCCLLFLTGVKTAVINGVEICVEMFDSVSYCNRCENVILTLNPHMVNVTKFLIAAILKQT